jgi:hypothetical protein
VNVAADEGFETLVVSELQIQHPAMAFHESESIELALVAGIVESAKVPPSIALVAPSCEQEDDFRAFFIGPDGEWWCPKKTSFWDTNASCVPDC